MAYYQQQQQQHAVMLQLQQQQMAAAAHFQYGNGSPYSSSNLTQNGLSCAALVAHSAYRYNPYQTYTNGHPGYGRQLPNRTSPGNRKKSTSDRKRDHCCEIVVPIHFETVLPQEDTTRTKIQNKLKIEDFSTDRNKLNNLGLLATVA
jgi:hypothetical protein